MSVWNNDRSGFSYAAHYRIVDDKTNVRYTDTTVYRPVIALTTAVSYRQAVDDIGSSEKYGCEQTPVRLGFGNTRRWRRRWQPWPFPGAHCLCRRCRWRGSRTVRCSPFSRRPENAWCRMTFDGKKHEKKPSPHFPLT